MNDSATPGRIKLFAAIIGGSAVVAFGALTAAMHQEQAVSGGDAGYFSKSPPAMTTGDTETNVVTTTDEPSVLPTEKAAPPLKATPFGGAGS